jgi:malonyl-CoA O-methyltransferase
MPCRLLCLAQQPTELNNQIIMLQVQTSDQYKMRLAKQFSRAAIHYDSLAAVQGDIAKDAIALLPSQCHTLLDLGCGTGRITQKLAAQSDHVIAVDLALGMLNHASSSIDDKTISWIQGDAEHLALSENTVDTVFSSMVLQWCASPQQVMFEINRVLKEQGQAVLAIMVDGSFTELKQVWAQLDAGRHINQFYRPEIWQQAAQDNGLRVELSTQCYQTWHPNLRTLLASIKGIGANVLIKNDADNVQTANTTFNRSTLTKLETLYLEQSGELQQLPLSYQIAFLHCIKS